MDELDRVGFCRECGTKYKINIESCPNCDKEVVGAATPDSHISVDSDPGVITQDSVQSKDKRNIYIAVGIVSVIILFLIIKSQSGPVAECVRLNMQASKDAGMGLYYDESQMKETIQMMCENQYG